MNLARTRVHRASSDREARMECQNLATGRVPTLFIKVFIKVFIKILLARLSYQDRPIKIVLSRPSSGS